MSEFPVSDGDRAAARPRKNRTVRVLPSSPTDWILRRGAGSKLALGLSVFAALAGVVMPFLPEAAGLIAGGFLATSVIIYLYVLQRVALTMRFESGPRSLDVPRKGVALRYVALIFLPAFVFATAFQIRHAVTSGFSVYRANVALTQLLDLSIPVPGPGFDAIPDGDLDLAWRGTAISLPGADPAVEQQAQQAHVREERRAILAELERRQAQREVQALEAINGLSRWWPNDLSAARRDIATLAQERRNNWSERAQLLALQEVPPAEAAAIAPVSQDIETPVYARACDDQQIDAACDLYRNLAIASLAHWSLALGDYSPAFGLGSVLSVAFSGFVGVFFFAGLALTGAILLRIVRLSDGPVPYLVSGLGAMATIAFSVSFIGNELPYAAFWFSSVLPYLSAAALAMGFVPAFRKDGVGGFIRRQFMLVAPIALGGLAVTPLVLNLYGGASPWIAVGVGTIAMVVALVVWGLWLLMDRAIVKANCRPETAG